MTQEEITRYWLQVFRTALTTISPLSNTYELETAAILGIIHDLEKDLCDSSSLNEPTTTETPTSTPIT